MTTFGRMRSLKARLGIGAALLALGTLATAATLWAGMSRVADRLDAALVSERRMARYAVLSTQASTFLVIATEAVQAGQPTATRLERLDPVIGQMQSTFIGLHADVAAAVARAGTLGLDAQSRYGTQSLGLARMEAMLDSTMRGLGEETLDPARLRAHIDTFASSFDPLLGQAVNTEVLFRSRALEGIASLRQALMASALVIAVLTIAAVTAFYTGLIRPSFRRLDRLRDAAERIRQEDFAFALPDTRNDEIGQIYGETNRMVAALKARQQAVQREWTQLNDTIAERTQALSAANSRLAETDENRRRLFADVSHELRTPLTVILLEAQIGRKTGGPGAEAFATIETRAARLSRRIDDLLRIARSENGQLMLDIGPAALGPLIDEVRAEIQAEIDNAGMTLEIVPVPRAMLHCDPNWIRQVIVSLVRNAVRHAREGGRIRIEATAGPEGVAIAVADNGPGIPGPDQSRIFERFAQGAAGTAQGFGVGLALAAWVARGHGGTITATSPLPRAEALGATPGTKIVVRLPAASD